MISDLIILSYCNYCIDSNSLKLNMYWLSFSITKAVKSTHRHPLNKTLHAIGLLLYIFALYAMVSFFIDLHVQNLLLALTLSLTAINLFILGHAVEGNVRAMTAIVLFKYVKSILTKNIQHWLNLNIRLYAYTRICIWDIKLDLSAAATRSASAIVRKGSINHGNYKEMSVSRLLTYSNYILRLEGKEKFYYSA
jgi:prepilin signal peptidase PulO-like enzyme (type II secretory pathway)